MLRVNIVGIGPGNPEPVFAGICQNILAVTHFHAC